MNPVPAFFLAPVPPSVLHAPWLYAFSVFGLFGGTVLAVAWGWRTALSCWEDPFPFRHPITAWRLVRIGMAVSVLLRIGPDAANIMLWPEVSPATRLWMADLNRCLDGISILPFAASFALCGLSGPIIHYQLGRQPIPYNLWPRPRQVGRGLMLTALLLVISLGVTVFRP